ncbi:type II toxin-antitoxin system RelE/ParE family toxin [Desulfosarcina ovata]|nr:type II toxin-antitoxin system RelE/ParE family toxin [Desulfosarcina ovata]
MKKPDEIEVRYYQDGVGRKPFANFFNRVNGAAAVKITAAITRLRAGNKGDSKSVGKGVSELRIHWGPGYRIYYGWDGIRLIILLSGGAKGSQSTDIKKAQTYWADYKRRKREGVG